MATSMRTDGHDQTKPLKEALASFQHGVAEVGGEVKTLAGAVKNEVKTRAMDARKVAGDGGRALYRAACASVRERPITAVGVAAAAGAIVAMALLPKRQ